MKIPFFVPDIGDEEKAAVVDVLSSGWLTTGPKCQLFQSEFRSVVGAGYALALNSCTAALHVALEAVGVNAGDRVVVPALTFAASAEVIRYLGAIPVFVDSDLSDGNMSLAHAEAVLSSLSRAGTPARAIIPVHYGGNMVDMRQIASLAETYHLAVVEDAAHAFPAWLGEGSGRIFPGALSDAACFSFYANKTITTGEGGMVVCNRQNLHERMRVMSLHGIDRPAYERYAEGGDHYYEIIAAGYKYNMTDLAAALGIVQLKKAEALRIRRRTLVQGYRDRLAKWSDELQVVGRANDLGSAFHLFVIRLLNGGHVRRDDLIKHLKANGIGVSVHWLPLHAMPYYRSLGTSSADLENAELLGASMVSLPLYPSMTGAQLDYVTAAIGQFLETVGCKHRGQR